MYAGLSRYQSLPGGRRLARTSGPRFVMYRTAPVAGSIPTTVPSVSIQTPYASGVVPPLGADGRISIAPASRRNIRKPGWEIQPVTVPAWLIPLEKPALL